jgi:hypothetical protein
VDRGGALTARLIRDVAARPTIDEPPPLDRAGLVRRHLPTVRGARTARWR